MEATEALDSLFATAFDSTEAPCGNILSNAGFDWSGYCLYRNSTMKAMGFAGFSISRFSTIEINNELMFFVFRYCCSSA
ncbi:hypothetical protein EON65_17510 [archaeon]|nr:MAG: hypothetical protein EON65_17510 [archaeon]